MSSNNKITHNPYWALNWVNWEREKPPCLPVRSRPTRLIGNSLSRRLQSGRAAWQGLPARAAGPASPADSPPSLLPSQLHPSPRDAVAGELQQHPPQTIILPLLVPSDTSLTLRSARGEAELQHARLSRCFLALGGFPSFPTPAAPADKTSQQLESRRDAPVWRLQPVCLRGLCTLWPSKGKGKR